MSDNDYCYARSLESRGVKLKTLKVLYLLMWNHTPAAQRDLDPEKHQIALQTKVIYVEMKRTTDNTMAYEAQRGRALR